MKKALKIGCLVLLLLVLVVVALARPNWRSIEVDGQKRHYLVAEPSSMEGPLPVLIFFHGGGGNAPMISRIGFSRLAEERGYLLVYPHAIRGHWQVGMTDHPKYDPNIDDLNFVQALLEQLKSQYSVDSSRIYAAGISNGGMMSHWVGAEFSEDFVAIAPVIGAIPQGLAERFAPKKQVSVLIMQGTEDPLVPYDGGPVTIGEKKWGSLLPTDEAAQLWADHNGCGQFEVENLPDPADDGCTIVLQRWSRADRNVEVLLYRVEGGGHTIPGGNQYLPVATIGPLCHDLDAVEVLGDFFDSHRREP